jgi:hypothetical protein
MQMITEVGAEQNTITIVMRRQLQNLRSTRVRRNFVGNTCSGFVARMSERHIFNVPFATSGADRANDEYSQHCRPLRRLQHDLL